MTDFSQTELPNSKPGARVGQISSLRYPGMDKVNTASPGENAVTLTSASYIDGFSSVNALDLDSARSVVSAWSPEQIAEAQKRFDEFVRKENINVLLRFNKLPGASAGIAHLAECDMDCVLLPLFPHAQVLTEQPGVQLLWLDWLLKHEAKHFHQKQLLDVKENTLTEALLKENNLHWVLRGMRNWEGSQRLPPLALFGPGLTSPLVDIAEKRILVTTLLDVNADAHAFDPSDPTLIAQGVLVLALNLDTMRKAQAPLLSSYPQPMLSIARFHASLLGLHSLLSHKTNSSLMPVIETELRLFISRVPGGPVGILDELRSETGLPILDLLRSAFEREVMRLFNPTDLGRYSQLVSGLMQFLRVSTDRQELTLNLDAMLRAVTVEKDALLRGALASEVIQRTDPSVALGLIQRDPSASARLAAAQELRNNSISAEQFIPFEPGLKLVRLSSIPPEKLHTLKSGDPNFHKKLLYLRIAQEDPDLLVPLTPSEGFILSTAAASVAFEALQSIRALNPDMPGSLVEPVMEKIAYWVESLNVQIGFTYMDSERDFSKNIIDKCLEIAFCNPNEMAGWLGAEILNGDCFSGAVKNGVPYRLKFDDLLLSSLARRIPEQLAPTLDVLFSHIGTRDIRYRLLANARVMLAIAETAHQRNDSESVARSFDKILSAAQWPWFPFNGASAMQTLMAIAKFAPLTPSIVINSLSQLTKRARRAPDKYRSFFIRTLTSRTDMDSASVMAFAKDASARVRLVVAEWVEGYCGVDPEKGAYCAKELLSQSAGQQGGFWSRNLDQLAKFQAHCVAGLLTAGSVENDRENLEWLAAMIRSNSVSLEALYRIPSTPVDLLKIAVSATDDMTARDEPVRRIALRIKAHELGFPLLHFEHYPLDIAERMLVNCNSTVGQLSHETLATIFENCARSFNCDLSSWAAAFFNLHAVLQEEPWPKTRFSKLELSKSPGALETLQASLQGRHTALGDYYILTQLKGRVLGESGLDQETLDSTTFAARLRDRLTESERRLLLVHSVTESFDPIKHQEVCKFFEAHRNAFMTRAEALAIEMLKRNDHLAKFSVSLLTNRCDANKLQRLAGLPGLSLEVRVALHSALDREISRLAMANDLDKFLACQYRHDKIDYLPNLGIIRRGRYLFVPGYDPLK